jgi:hypothetical protein
MQSEREELLKRVLPQIRKLCAGRGVSWNEVDLRWGITEEQSRRGDVLPVCLGEIDRCRPFFLCLLGERSGWVPDHIPMAPLFLAEYSPEEVTGWRDSRQARDRSAAPLAAPHRAPSIRVRGAPHSGGV